MNKPPSLVHGPLVHAYLAISTDSNQFVGTSGRDAWDPFFKELSPYTLEEVYDSWHAVLDQNSNINMNPYLTELLFTNIRAEGKYRGLLRYRDDAKEFIDKTLADVLPQDDRRALAVVTRGTDYTAEQLAKYAPKHVPKIVPNVSRASRGRAPRNAARFTRLISIITNKYIH